MPVLTNWNISVDVNDVLRAQGVPSVSSLRRSTRLIKTAEWAVETVRSLIHPVVIIEHVNIAAHEGEKTVLDGGHILSGELPGHHLANADSVWVAACTISSEVEKTVQELQADDLIRALALDGAGTAAVEKLSTEVRNFIEQENNDPEIKVTLPLNPGMIGWPLESGQEQVFSILGPLSDAIRLNKNSMMAPCKSLSFVIGCGRAVSGCGTMCDYCAMNSTCKYSKRNLQEKQLK